MIRLVAFVACCGVTPVLALEPAQVFLLVNKNVPESATLAAHYRKVRQIPDENTIVLDVPTQEDISRKDYDEKVVPVVRQALAKHKANAKCLVCMYGIPLRVGTQSPTMAEQEELKKLDTPLKEAQDTLKKAQDELKTLESKKDLPNAADQKKALDKQIQEQQTIVAKLNRQRSFLQHAESQASVDSELMLLWWDKYELRRWQINLNHFQLPAKAREGKEPVLLTCRLDGPTPKIVERMIDDAVATEKVGLKGKVYVDARGIRFDAKGNDPSGTGYGGYDESMREMAALLKEAKLDVVLDDKNDLFAAGSSPDCALYCGWYSHANFIDCCTYVRGSVAWHLASSEAVSLRRPDAKYWCKNLLEKGVCATLGPVAEPYTVGFPKPAEFFGYLATGQYTLVEAYGKTVYFASWMGTLIGDPLYNPYKKNPAVKEADLFASPKGAKPVFRD